MAYTVTISIALGAGNTGLTLNAQLYDTTGVSVGGLITTGFLARGGGNYLLTASVPAGFRGGIDIINSADSAVLGSIAINPEDIEYIADIKTGVDTLVARLTSVRAGLLDNLTNLDALISSRLATAGYTAPDNTGIASLVSRLTSTRAALLDNLTNLDALISSRLATAGYTAPDNSGISTLVARLTSSRATLLDNLSNLDALISSRLASASYTAPDNTNIVAAKTNTDTLLTRLTSIRAGLLDNLSNLDTLVSSRLATAGYTAPDNASISAIQVDAAALVARLTADRSALLDNLVNLDAAISSINTSGDAPTAAEIRAEIDTNSTQLAAIVGYVDSLETRLTSTRAALLDNLTNLDALISSRLASASYTAPDNTNIAAAKTNTDTLVARITASRALLIDNLSRLDATISSLPSAAAIRAEIDANSTDMDAIVGYVDALEARLTATRAGLLDNLANLDTLVSTRLASADYTAPDNATIAVLASRVTSARALLLDNLSNLDTLVSSRLASSGYTAPDNAGIAAAEADLATLLARITEARATLLDNLSRLDTEVSTRLATAGYTAPDNASITSIKTDTTAIRTDTASLLGRITSARALLLDNLANVDAAISTRLAAASYTAPDNTNIAAAKTNTDTLIARLTSARALLLDNLSNLDALVSTRLASSSYEAPDNATITGINTAVTQIGDDVDAIVLTLAAINSTVDSIETMVTAQAGGKGLYTITITVVDDADTPIKGATVAVYNNGQTTLVAGPLITNNDGQVLLNLDPATYKVVVASTAQYHTFTPQTLTVTANGSVSYTLTRATVIETPTDPSVCRLYGWVKDLNGQALKKTTVTVRLVSQSAMVAAGSVLNAAGQLTLHTNAEGYFQADLIRSDILEPLVDGDDTRWRVSCPAAKIDVKLELTASTQELSAALLAL